MNNKIKAIETQYKGHKFRSRLEARWAVFFDTLGLEWQYEPEGFHTEVGMYLPDFYLPEHKTWVEVKGVRPEPDPKMPMCPCGCGKHMSRESLLLDNVVAGTDSYYGLIVGPFKGDYFEFWRSMFYGGATPANYMEILSAILITEGHVSYEGVDKGALRCAIRKASQARFEHGERG